MIEYRHSDILLQMCKSLVGPQVEYWGLVSALWEGCNVDRKIQTRFIKMIPCE